jgi:hypothetical protein
MSGGDCLLVETQFCNFPAVRKLKNTGLSQLFFISLMTSKEHSGLDSQFNSMPESYSFPVLRTFSKIPVVINKLKCVSTSCFYFIYNSFMYLFSKKKWKTGIILSVFVQKNR